MIIAVGADHRGTVVLKTIAAAIEQQGFEIRYMGRRERAEACDYPDVAYPVARAVANGDADRGILVCGSGIGMCIAANKVKGVRAALVHDEIGAEMSRRHNNANILCLAGDLLGIRILERIVNVWLCTGFDGGRHARRVAKISAIEAGQEPDHEADATPATTPAAPAPGADSAGVAD
ncbi:MAG: ribose 5-phosphate isomerase B [Phycisphaeraceae bacterium]